MTNQTTRNERLKQLIEWSAYKSVNAFAKKVGISQRTMSDWMNEKTSPKDEALLKIVEVFPEFNADWLLYGRGEMFNPKYVTVNEPNYSNVATGNNKQLNQSVNGNEKYVQELENSRMSILKLVLRKIAKAMECPTKEESDAKLRELEEDLTELGL